MIFISNYINVLREYAEFDGRASRTEFWLFALAQAIVLVAFWAVVQALPRPINALFTGISVMYVIGTLLPMIGLTMRRFHDAGRSRWMALLWLVPVVGWVVMAVFMALPSVAGDDGDGAEEPQEAVGA